MSKKVIKDGINISENIKYKDINGNFLDKIPGNKWKIQVEGEFVDMSKNVTLNSLAKLVENGFEKINSRLDVLESLPTIQKELKSKNKK